MFKIPGKFQVYFHKLKYSLPCLEGFMRFQIVKCCWKANQNLSEPCSCREVRRLCYALLFWQSHLAKWLYTGWTTAAYTEGQEDLSIFHESVFSGQHVVPDRSVSTAAVKLVLHGASAGGKYARTFVIWMPVSAYFFLNVTWKTFKSNRVQVYVGGIENQLTGTSPKFR